MFKRAGLVQTTRSHGISHFQDNNNHRDFEKVNSKSSNFPCHFISPLLVLDVIVVVEIHALKQGSELLNSVILRLCTW